MAGNLTDAEEIRLLDLSLPTGAGAAGYLALFTAVGAEDGTGWTEPTDASYARQPYTVAAANAAGKLGPTADVLFPAVAATPYTVLAIGVVSALTGGVIRWKRALSTAAPDERRTINVGDQYRVPANSLTHTLD